MFSKRIPEPEIEQLAYYFGIMDSEAAHKALEDAPNNSYLLRWSSNKKSYYFTLKDFYGAFDEIPVETLAQALKGVGSYQLVGDYCAHPQPFKKNNPDYGFRR